MEALVEAHDRSQFNCDEPALDRYFQTQVTQDIRRNVTNCFVAIEHATGRIAAYYTLASTGIPAPELPPALVKRLPRYPLIPAARIGRLAVDRQFRGRGLGSALLIDATQRTLRAAPAAFAYVVDAKNDRAAAFYRHHGFVPFTSQAHTLFLPLASAAKALGSATGNK